MDGRRSSEAPGPRAAEKHSHRHKPTPRSPLPLLVWSVFFSRVAENVRVSLGADGRLPVGENHTHTLTVYCAVWLRLCRNVEDFVCDSCSTDCCCVVRIIALQQNGQRFEPRLWGCVQIHPCRSIFWFLLFVCFSVFFVWNWAPADVAQCSATAPAAVRLERLWSMESWSHWLTLIVRQGLNWDTC